MDGWIRLVIGRIHRRYVTRMCVCVFWRRHAPHSTLGLYGVLGCTNSRRRKPYRMTCTCTLGPDFFCCISNLLTRLIRILFFLLLFCYFSRRNCLCSFNSVFEFYFFVKQLLQLADIFFNSMGKTVEFVWSGAKGCLSCHPRIQTRH